jgi:tetratricopeptide (TPR) repeat protein
MDDTLAFLDVHALLEQSQPRGRTGWAWYGLGGFLLVVMVSTYVQQEGAAGQDIVHFVASASMFALLIAMALLTFHAMRSQRHEQAQIESVEELLQLRRWSQAAAILGTLLSRPTRTPLARVQGLIYLCTILARYHRFADTIAVQEHLLEHVPLDEATAYGLRLGRAMALLRETQLFDADGAISELRRSPQASESGGLVLVEIYRDVVTGHPADAVQRFTAGLPMLRRQLGHRVADAWVLAAKAYDMLERAGDAQAAYTKATLLVPPQELARRWPEAAALQGKYAAAEAPREMDYGTPAAAGGPA